MNSPCYASWRVGYPLHLHSVVGRGPIHIVRDSTGNAGGLAGFRPRPEGAVTRGRPIPFERGLAKGQLRARIALSSSRFDSRSLHVADPEALAPPAPAAHALLCVTDHRIGGR